MSLDVTCADAQQLPLEDGEYEVVAEKGMTENQLTRLREIGKLLASALDGVNTMLWYTKHDCEIKGFQWLMSAARLADEAQRRLKTFCDEQSDGYLMLENPIFKAERDNE